MSDVTVKQENKSKKINKMTNDELIQKINSFKNKNEVNSKYYVDLVKQAKVNGLDFTL